MNDVIVYNNGELEINVSVNQETVWLNRNQISELFDRDIKTIGKHINNIFKDQELEKISVVANFATTASDGKNYNIEHYNLDVIISVGYRVKSKKGVHFRQWATKVLKELKQGVFYNGQIFDAYVLVSNLIKSAKNTIILIDNYIDESTLTLFSKNTNIKIEIYTQTISKQLKLDVEKYNKQYKDIELKQTKSFHDRFMIIDNQEVYHIGASLKDLGKKVFAFSKIDIFIDDITKRL